MNKKGFTLIELLIVIGILAVLATAVVIVLNPVQLLKQGRDSTRISDMAAANSAVALYLTTATSTDLNPNGSCANRCTASSTAPFSGSTSCATVTTSTAVTGSGWISVNFGDTSGGSPLAKLPLDPVNDSTNFYAYTCSEADVTYEINANMESTKYANSGTGDVESKDGGSSATWYEVGSDPGLDL